MKNITHRVVSKGSYSSDTRFNFQGTPDACADWVNQQEHPEWYEIQYTIAEQKRRNLLRKLTGEEEPKFITEREEVMIDKFLTIEDDYDKRLDKSAESAANNIENFLNSYTAPVTKFIDLMARTHRTHQQSFTKLCLMWIEKVASPEYTYDGRNEASHKQCKRLLDNWLIKHPDDGVHMDENLLKGSPPSDWLRMI